MSKKFLEEIEEVSKQASRKIFDGDDQTKCRGNDGNDGMIPLNKVK